MAEKRRPQSLSDMATQEPEKGQKLFISMDAILKKNAPGRQKNK
jgi:hypothetical protein